MPRFFNPLLKTLALAGYDQLVAKIEYRKAEDEMLRRRRDRRAIGRKAQQGLQGA